MQFSPSDRAAILAATGEPITVMLGAAVVKTFIGKFRKNFQAVSPYQSDLGILLPAFTCDSDDLAGITNAHHFVIGGTEYKYDGKPEEQPSGFTLVKLGKK